MFYLSIYIFFNYYFLSSLCTYFTTTMKVLCNNRPTVVNLTIGYETVMRVKKSTNCTAVFCLFVFFFFIAFLHFPGTIRQLPCIIDIGTHKPWLLVPFAMCNCNEFLCQMITARMISCVYDLLNLSYMYYMAIKTYSLSLSTSSQREIDISYLKAGELSYHEQDSNRCKLLLYVQLYTPICPLEP